MKKNYKLKHLVLAPAILAFSFSLAQERENQIRSFLDQNGESKNIPQILKDFDIVNQDPSASLKGDVVIIQQKVNEIPIYQRVTSLLIQNQKISTTKFGFEKNVAVANIGSSKAQISKNQALQSALQHGKFKNPANYQIGERLEGNTAQAKLYYLPVSESLKLVYEVTFYQEKSENLWVALVDAQDAKVISVKNTTLYENHNLAAVSHRSYDDIGATKTYAFPQNQSQKTLLAPSNASYRVFALPVEAPTFGGRTLVSNPWDLSASPEGWHSTIANSYTYTRGNNVYAYTDEDNNDAPGTNTDGGSSRVFDFPLDITQAATTYTNAAVTNLFYLNNKVHDIFYKFGFTETARNFQTNNFGKGGTGNDAVLAEARDGGGTNNANFSSPAEGSQPRMQMYLWDPANVKGLRVNAPADLVDFKPNVSYAVSGMGPALTATGVTGDLALSQPLDACTALTNASLTNQLVLVKRGTCDFVTKIKNAQAKGAKGVILFNNETGGAVSSFGTADATVTIPSVFISNADGEVLKGKLDQAITTNVTIYNDPSTSVNIDGSLDNGIITHEYGHGISNRLTGTGSGCLDYTVDNEQMGEGWSDYFALMLTLQPTDNATIPRGIGTFAVGEPTTGTGIRPAKYSPNRSINDFTYGDTNGKTRQSSLFGIFPITVPDVHTIGFIWATMIWDLTWKYVEKYGYESDVTANTTSGTARALQVVMDGLKLQACNPSFINGRDAIIAADQAQTGGQNKCLIWNVFASRGLGVNANAGGLNGIWYEANAAAPDLNDQVEDFTVPSECTLGVNNTVVKNTAVIYPNPAKDEIHFSVKGSKGISVVKIYDLSGKLVQESRVDLNSSDALPITNLKNGVYVVKGEGLGVNFAEKIIVKK